MNLPPLTAVLMVIVLAEQGYRSLFVIGKADAGGSGSKFTYQLLGGVGLLMGKRFALIGGYRDLKVNYNKDNFLLDMALHGPIIGVSIRF